MTIEDGYAIQRAWVDLELADGRSIKGRKIGLTSRAMQQASQITEPDFAPLMDDMFFDQGSDIEASRFIAPRIEVELAFILGRPLKGPGVTLFDVLSLPTTSPATRSSMRIEQFDRDTRRAQGLRHHQRLCGERVVLGRPVRPGRGSALGRRAAGNGVIGKPGCRGLNLSAGVAWLANRSHYDERQYQRVVAAGFADPGSGR
jgi:2-oxo-hept-3-ene-1,7-dioate hydratase